MDKVMYTSAEAENLLKAPVEEIQRIVSTSNRAQRRAWTRATKKRGRGFTK